MNNIQDKHPTNNAEQLCNLDKRDRYLSFLMFSGAKKVEASPYFESEANSGSQAASLIIQFIALKELKLQDWLYVIS